MKIGSMFETDLGLQDLAEIVKQVCVSKGFACDTIRVAEDEIQIDARQTAPWFRVLLLALPQHLRWRSWTTGGETVVHGDSFYFRWYRWVLIVMWTLVTAVLMMVSVLASSSPTVGVLASSLGALLALALVLRLVLTGDDIETEIGNRIERWVETRQHYCRVSMPRAVPRTTINAIPVFLSLLAFIGLLSIDVDEVSVLDVCVMLVVLALLGSMIGVVIVLFRSRPAIYRLAALLPSIIMVLGITLLIIGILGFAALGTKEVSEWDALFEFRDRFERGEDPNPPSFVDASTSVEAYSVLRGRMAVGPIAGTVLCIFAVISFRIGLRGVKGVFRGDAMLNRREAERAGVSEHAFVMTLRAVVIPVWLILGSVNTLCIVVVSLIAFSKSLPFGSESVGAVVASAGVIEFLSHQPQHSAMPLARTLWLGVALFLIALPVTSIGLFCLRVLGLWRFVRTVFMRRLGSDRAVEVQRTLDDMARRANCVPPRLVLGTGTNLLPASFTLSLRERSRYIAVPRHYLTMLTEDELEALLAHELAHHICGHCHKHFLLQLLGRITFVGDGFVGALENSFGYELEADRVAVRDLGADPHALDRCLSKMAGATALESLLGKKPIGLGMTSSDELQGESALPYERVSIVESIRLWCRFYLCDTAMSYWHPTLAVRVQALREM